jgi:hypothetical protein
MPRTSYQRSYLCCESDRTATTPCNKKAYAEKNQLAVRFGHWQPTLLALLSTENARILRAVTSVLALGSLRRDIYHHQDGVRTASRLSVDTNSEGGMEALREMGMISVENLSLSSASSER